LVRRFTMKKEARLARMEFVLTDHAKEEARRRQIPLEWIRATMVEPEQVTAGTN
jgi:hypothetical protein